MTLTDFEVDSIRIILQNEAPELMKYLPKIFASSRQDNGVGRYVNLSVDQPNSDQRSNLTIGKKLYADIEGMVYGVGFILFVDDGLPSVLEIYSHGNEIIPSIIKSYEFRYI